MGSHRYRRQGFRYVQPAYNSDGVRWVAQGQLPGGGNVNLGTFDTPLRAQIAVRLYKLWLAKGFDVSVIPRMPRTKDAI